MARKPPKTPEEMRQYRRQWYIKNQARMRAYYRARARRKKREEMQKKRRRPVHPMRVHMTFSHARAHAHAEPVCGHVPKLQPPRLTRSPARVTCQGCRKRLEAAS
jgi:hypothetical protein